MTELPEQPRTRRRVNQLKHSGWSGQVGMGSRDQQERSNRA
jgi:hypothetical protein